VTELTSPNPIDKYLEEVKKSVFFQDKKTVDSFQSLIEWYRKRSPHKRLYYRASGLLIIVLGIALPILAVFGKDLEYKDLWVSVLAGLIALLTGLNSFFRWDVAWRGHIQALLTLDRLQKEWEFAIAKARALPDAGEGLKLAIEATEQFQTRAHDTVEAEAKGFFTVQRLPGAKADVEG
jgi:hypothetical protein